MQTLKSQAQELIELELSRYFDRVTKDTKGHWRVAGNNEMPYIAIYIESLDKLVYLNSDFVDTMPTAYKYAFYTVLKCGKVFARKADEYGIDYKPIKARLMRDLLSKSGRFSDADLDSIFSEFNISEVSFEIMSLEDGYNNPDIRLGSCMEGDGEYFKPFYNMAQFYALKYKGEYKARCIVWDAGVVFKSLNHKLGQCADRLYYSDGFYRDLLVEHLIDNDIIPLWGIKNEGGFDYKDYYIKAPKVLYSIVEDENEMCWMDTFNHFNTTKGLLYSYDWRENGYDKDCLNFDEDTPVVFLATDGHFVTNGVYSEYEGEYIDRDEACYSERENTYFSEDNDDFVWLNAYNDYFLADDCEYVDDYGWAYREDCIYSECEGRYYYASHYTYIELGNGDIAGDDNPNIVYCELDDEYNHEDECVYSRYHDTSIRSDLAVWDEALNDNFHIDDDLDEIRAELNKAVGE